MADAAAAGPAVIVFHQEDQRQLPELGQVQRLVENSFLHGAIAEKDHRHRARFLNSPEQRRGQARLIRTPRKIKAWKVPAPVRTVAVQVIVQLAAAVQAGNTM